MFDVILVVDPWTQVRHGQVEALTNSAVNTIDSLMDMIEAETFVHARPSPRRLANMQSYIVTLVVRLCLLGCRLMSLTRHSSIQPPQSKVCGCGMAILGDACVCGCGMAMLGDACACGRGMAMLGDACACGRGMAMLGDACACGRGMAIIGDACACGRGMAIIGNACVARLSLTSFGAENSMFEKVQADEASALGESVGRVHRCSRALRRIQLHCSSLNSQWLSLALYHPLKCRVWACALHVDLVGAPHSCACDQRRPMPSDCDQALVVVVLLCDQVLVGLSSKAHLSPHRIATIQKGGPESDVIVLCLTPIDAKWWCRTTSELIKNSSNTSTENEREPPAPRRNSKEVLPASRPGSRDSSRRSSQKLGRDPHKSLGASMKVTNYL